MAAYIPDIDFARPELLWLFLVLPILWLRFFDQRWVVILGRTVILSLLILALADPRTVDTQTTREERLYAFDLSRSISSNMRQWMEQRTTREFSPRDGDRVFLFGGETRPSNQWSEALNGKTNANIEPDKTNLEKLLTTLLSLPPRPRNLFLFTDGWQTEGSVERLLPLISGTGLKIFPIIPVAPLPLANVAVTKLLGPTHGNSGESINLRAAVENYSDRQIEGTLALQRNGQTLKSERVKLNPGSHIFPYHTTLPDTATADYRASFVPIRPGLDDYAPDNHAITSVTVRTKAKVLLLNGRPGAGRYLEEIVKRQGFEVTSRTPDSAPPVAGFDVIIFNNAERGKFSPAYLASVEKHVAAGNGFLMVGNEASFAPNSYERTPVEAVLPVEPREPPKREEKNRAVILVIDKSGSMREDNRILYAQEAAKAVVRQLKDNDFVGVVGFDVSPFVIVPLTSVGEVRRGFDAQIERLRPGGRTYLLPAINEAKRQLQRQEAAYKHVLILSDGETGGSGGDYIDLVHVMRTELKITVSAVAIGAEANLPLMKRLTQYGGGFFHHTFDPSSLPRIVLQQIQEPVADEPKRQRDLVPVQESKSEILAGFPGRNYPRVLGYMDTELKRGATLDLALPNESRRAPLLASWRYGRGRSVALTMDMEGRYSRDWIQWSSLHKFWDKILSWLQPEKEPIASHEARVSLVNMQPVLDLYLYEPASAESEFGFSITGKSTSRKGTLKQIAPGHFQTPLPINEPGDYKIDLFERRRERTRPFPPVAYSLPYDFTTEAPRSGSNVALLTQLAQASGGQINPQLADVTEKPSVTYESKPNRDPLIAAAFLLFLFEVALRKFILSEAD